MPPVKKTPASPTPSNVHALKAAPAPFKVQPPDDWVLEGQFGHMAFEAGEGGRLVRLADVLRWLQAAREIPRSEALRELCDVVPVDVMGWLYWVRRGAYADPVPVVYAFGYRTALQAEERSVAATAAAKKRDREAASKASWAAGSAHGHSAAQDCVAYHPASYAGQSAPRLSQRKYTPPPTSEPGQPAFLMYLQSQQAVEELEMTTPRSGSRDDGPKDATTLSIRLDKAYALWVYGTVAASASLVADVAPSAVTTYSDLVQHRKSEAGLPWFDAHVDLMAIEIDRRTQQGQKGVRKGVGEELGISQARISDLLINARKRQPAIKGLQAGRQAA